MSDAETDPGPEAVADAEPVSDRQVSLAALRRAAKSKKNTDLGIDAGVNAALATMLPWWVMHTQVAGWADGWWGALAALGGSLGMVMAGSIVSGIAESSGVPPRWSDALGYTVAAIGTGFAATRWYPDWFGVAISAFALVVFWPMFLASMRRFRAQRSLGLPAQTAQLFLSLPRRLPAGVGPRVDRALQAYADLSDGAALLPEHERHLVDDAETSLRAVAVQARIVHRLHRRDSVPLAAARQVADARLDELVEALEGLVAAVVTYDAAARQGVGLDSVRERAESLRLLAAAHAELDAL